jgi:signal peptidase II
MSRAPKNRYLLLSLAVVAADQWSKWMVEEHLPPLASRQILPGLLDLTHVRNTGVAFGMFAARGSLLGTVALTALGLVALAIIGLYFHRTASGERLLLASLALILGGALGNLIDRLFSGGVTDFIDFYYRGYHFHTFNLADSAITVGICLMAVDALLRRDSEPTES